MNVDDRLVEHEGPPRYCATHTNVETGLSCGRCGRLICPRCLVQTPVGGRCRACARVRRSPVFDVSGRQYALAAGASVLVGGVTGVGWAVLLAAIGWIFFLPWLLAAGVGYLVGEAVSASVNRKRGTGLAVIAALGVLVAYAVVVGVTLGRSGLGFYTPFNIVFALMFLAVAVYIAVNRVR